MKKYAEEVARIISEKNNGIDANVVEVSKANVGKMTGITVREIGKDVAPTFYVNDAFNNGISAQELADEFIASAKEKKQLTEEMQEVSKFDFSYKAVKDRMTLKLIEEKANRDFLQTVVHKPAGCGLVIVPYIKMGEDSFTAVTCKLAEVNEYDTEDLFRDALDNGNAMLATMTDMMFSQEKQNLLEGGKTHERMLILTNENGMFGACAMFYPKVLEKVKDVVEGDYYVLPSSIHEVIVVPKSNIIKERDLKAMVLEANKTVVTEADKLSDNVYLYDGELKVVA